MDARNTQGLVEADNAVIIATFEQMVVGEKITTLDVKNELRNNDFWVTQKQVSNAVMDFVEENDDKYDFFTTGGHRVYIEAAAPNPGAQLYPPTTKATRNQAVGDWTIRGGGDQEDYCNMTRNQAKYLFSQQFGVPYVDVRSKSL